MNEPKQATHTPPFRFRVDARNAGHTTFSVFVGEEGQGGNSGWLTLRNEEYDVLAPLLLAAPDLLDALECIVEHAYDFAKLPGYRVTDPDREHGARIMAEFELAVSDARDLIERVRGGQA